MKKKEREIKKNIEAFGKEIEERKKIPLEEKKKIRKKILINMAIMIGIICYLLVLNIGEKNIQTDIYLISLKVLSIISIIITLCLFEISYKKNNNEMILHSIETLILSLFTLFLISAYSLYYGSFYKVIYTAMGVVGIYYIVKSCIIRKIMKNKYYKSLSDIKTIVAKR